MSGRGSGEASALPNNRYCFILFEFQSQFFCVFKRKRIFCVTYIVRIPMSPPASLPWCFLKIRSLCGVSGLALAHSAVSFPRPGPCCPGSGCFPGSPVASPPAWFFFQYFVTGLGPLHFLRNFRISLSSSTEKPVAILTEFVITAY